MAGRLEDQLKTKELALPRKEKEKEEQSEGVLSWEDPLSVQVTGLYCHVHF